MNCNYCSEETRAPRCMSCLATVKVYKVTKTLFVEAKTPELALEIAENLEGVSARAELASVMEAEAMNP